MTVSPKQSAAVQGNPYRDRHPAYSVHYPIECIVAQVHLPEDQTNRSKREVEYDVVPVLQNLGRINNVPLALGVHGIVDADETLLKPMGLILPSGSADLRNAVAAKTDGDRVIIQFLNGAFHRPVITHVLTHYYQGDNSDGQAPKYKDKTEILLSRAGYEFGTGSTGSTEAAMAATPGERLRHVKINGTHLAVDTNGDVFVNFKEHPDAKKGLGAGNVNKKLVVQHEGVDTFRVEKSGSNVDIHLGETLGLNVVLHVGDGSQSAAIAEKLQALYNTLKGKLDAFDAHTHVVTGTLPAGPAAAVAGPPTPLIAAPTWDPDIASANLKLEG